MMINYFHSKETCCVLFEQIGAVSLVSIFTRENTSLLKYCHLLYIQPFANLVSDALCEHQKSGRESHFAQQEGDEGNFLSLGFFVLFFPF